MEELKTYWSKKLVSSIIAYAKDQNLEEITQDSFNFVVETPPKPELGDISFPLFPLAKIFRQSPVQIALELKKYLEMENDGSEIITSGAYINIKLNSTLLFEKVLEKVFKEGDFYGSTSSGKENSVMVEFSCPNTNKPLHLGHLRNDSIGESISNILAANGSVIKKVNLINDRGIHICKSMLAYRKFGKNTTPESEGIKSDHFVGNYYVRYNNWVKDYPEAEEEARKMLREWESGDPDVRSLWKQMNSWTIEGIKKTYEETGIHFDTFYFESETYKTGRTEILKGLEKGVFYKEDDGSIWADLSEIGLDKKVLLRSDGTSLYLTQDIGTAITRHNEWPFDQLIYVVGSEQQYHFKVLFYILKKLGFHWADNLYHLSYGMVNLPDGKMKSREGTVVDGDDLFARLREMARREILDKKRIDTVDDVENTASAVALAALNYYLLQISPGKDMIFNPEKSISFNGNTGPYLQYMGARISSMLRKFEDIKNSFSKASVDYSLLDNELERELVKKIALYQGIVKNAGIELNPSLIAGYLYDLSRLFSRYYHDIPILTDSNKNIAITRVELVKAILQVLKNAFRLIGIPFLERM